MTLRVKRTRPPVRGSAQLAEVPLPVWGGSRTTLPSVRNRSPKADTAPLAYSSMYSQCTHDVFTARVRAERRLGCASLVPPLSRPALAYDSARVPVREGATAVLALMQARWNGDCYVTMCR